MIVMRNRNEIPAHLSRFVLLLGLSFCVTATALGQLPRGDEEFDPDAAPPPVKVLSSSERSQLESKQDLKGRTKLALALMSTRLSKAEELNAKSEFAEMYDELGGFHALMDDTLEFLENAPRRDKTLSNLKRFEITLRGFAPRLGLIRRELPSEYDHYVRSLIRYLRDARSKAIEPFFDDSIVPQRRTT